jgi:hypothetical protein
MQDPRGRPPHNMAAQGPHKAKSGPASSPAQSLCPFHPQSVSLVTVTIRRVSTLYKLFSGLKFVILSIQFLLKLNTFQSVMESFSTSPPLITNQHHLFSFFWFDIPGSMALSGPWRKRGVGLGREGRSGWSELIKRGEKEGGERVKQGRTRKSGKMSGLASNGI